MLKMVQSSSQQLSLDIVMGYMVSKKPEKDIPFVLDEHTVEQTAKRAKMLVVREKVLGLIFSGRFNGVSEATPILLEIATLLICLYGLCVVEDKSGTLTENILCVSISPYISPLLTRCLSGTQSQFQENNQQKIQLEGCAPQRSDGLTDSNQTSPLDVLSINYLTCVARISGSIRHHTLAIVRGIRHEIERWGDYQNMSALSALLTPICSWRNEEGNLRSAAKSVGKYIKRILELCGLLASEQTFPVNKRGFPEDIIQNEADINKVNNSNQYSSYGRNKSPKYKERLSIAIRSTSLLCMMFGMDTVLNVVDTMIHRVDSSEEVSPTQSNKEVPKNHNDVQNATIENMPKLYLSEMAENLSRKSNEFDLKIKNENFPSPKMSPKRMGISQMQLGIFDGTRVLETRRSIPPGVFFQALDTIAEEDEDVNTSNEVNNKEEGDQKSYHSPLSAVLQEQQQQQEIKAQQRFFASSKKFNSEGIKPINQKIHIDNNEKNEEMTTKIKESKISSPKHQENNIGNDPNSILKQGLLTIVRNELRIRTILKILSKDDIPAPRDRKLTAELDSKEDKKGKNSNRAKPSEELSLSPVNNANLDNKGFNDEMNQFNPNFSKVQNKKTNHLNGDILSQVTKTSVINVSNLKSGPNYDNNNSNEKQSQYPPPTITVTIPKTPPNSSMKVIEERQGDESNEAQYSYTYDEYSCEYSSNAIDKFGDVCNSSSFHETKHCVIANAHNKQDLADSDKVHDVDVPRTIIEEVKEENSESGSHLGGSSRIFRTTRRSTSKSDDGNELKEKNGYFTQGNNNNNKPVRQRVKKSKHKIVLPPIERGEI